MKRPVGVTIVAALFIIFGVLAFLERLWMFHQDPAEWERLLLKEPTRWWSFLLVWFTLVLAACWPVAGIGLWRLRDWGRRLAVVLCSLAVAWGPIVLVAYYFTRGFFNFQTRQQIPWLMRVWAPWVFVMFFFGSILGYMFTGQVKRAFSP